MVSREMQRDYWADFNAYMRSILSLSCIARDYAPTRAEVEGERRFWRSHRALSRQWQRRLYLQKQKFRK